MIEPAYITQSLPDREVPFYWESRLILVFGTSSKMSLREVPLTRDDILNPQEGDGTGPGRTHPTIRDSKSGERLLTSDEEAAALRTAEEELTQLREQTARLKGSRSKKDI